mgnify:FL=1
MSDSKKFELVLSPDIALDDQNLRAFLRSKGWLGDEQYFLVDRRSIDARKLKVKVNISLSISAVPLRHEFVEYEPATESVLNAPKVIIVGAGPAGLFAALKAISLGYRPIIIERGKDVRGRRRDLADVNKKGIVNPDSNYCFGEGGAGTYSDGKLYTRAKKRGSVRRIFEILVAHGAPEDILFEAYPHIGTNKLPKIVSAIRETIEELGGTIHFNARVNKFIIENGSMRGVVTKEDRVHQGIGVILATGHSARDIFNLCLVQGIKIESKPFALGLRVEHPQEQIDQIQYHTNERGLLPAASYAMAYQSKLAGKERGVFSFCMCPGGFIVPASTSPDEIVVNGMSPSRRDSKFANSGIVVAIEEQDIKDFQFMGPLAGMEFQASLEKRAWQSVSKGQMAPAQRLEDFINGVHSSSLNASSYQPGLESIEMRTILPKCISERLKQGFRFFDHKMQGYITNEAQIIGIESRTSSPVRIPRDKITCEHQEIKRLFPCGEGAGYAGGIVSAAMDGERCMDHLAKLYLK